MNERVVLSITGGDRIGFLQGLVTNDIDRPVGTIVYAALLTPQGKFIADFFVIPRADALLIDVDATAAATLAQRLTMYRLRADVQIAESSLAVSRGTGAAPEGALADPRHEALGWRHYGDGTLGDDTDWLALRIAHLIPQTGIELTPETYILEAGFERLNGVDFKKGCFVGQEIVARMKHKTDLRKGLARVRVDGAATPGTEITVNGKPAGQLHSLQGGRGIAFLRFDRATGDMQAGDATVHRD